MINAIRSNSQAGDILYDSGDNKFDQLITGHMAIYQPNANERSGRKWLTAYSDGLVLGTYYWTDRTQVDPVKYSAQKMLRVNSGVSPMTASNEINACDQRYSGIGYWIPPRKRDMFNLATLSEHGGHYCSQMSWRVWSNMGTDIDGTPWTTSFSVNKWVTEYKTVTIKIGWVSYTFTTKVLYYLVSWVTQDVVYPWDVVIDDNTTEYIRFGPANPAN